ncbi:bifunctional diguanylate cyclase/phosphodiesterase [Aurantiacibacter sp. MUD11]|uniref:putative bifunctional diguanylate cyclase/phosphodiesterase n=1 Tax=Aurantiacibacter sp. MUD11 TaxID=3003265 RepID=UPI0022A9FCF8|nr:bifunctional diguanylate cyclase/phosphodiesterase [Aurantiacibacter sp. MUD11]WAT17469.1 bifunctional diguanylate cyclase/phosphodiesterase [Aurantiacibacter sp. MUD11]
MSIVFGGILYALVNFSSPPIQLTRGVVLGSLGAYVLSVTLVAKFGFAKMKALEKVGLTDSLSGLPNRRALHNDFKALHGDEQEAALALIDLDGFKQVNDNYGHFVGDRLINECAKIFRDASGEEATVYRLGGDEFAMLTVGPIASNILEGICRRLLVRLTKPVVIDDRVIVIGASIGLARSDPNDGLTSSEMLRRTDVAMYASKRAGKMRCTWFSEEFDTLREELAALDHDLRIALREGQFHLHYQPLVDASTKDVVAVEALIRWTRPDGKHVGPNIFIPVAEESGLINQIGMWVLRQGCIDALGWDDIKLSVNVSAAQLRNPEFPVELGYLLEETGFPPERLELEVTETHLVLDSVIAGNSMDVIRDFGVRIVLDDFGTGYASIGFLRQFRFEKLKLDRSLIVEAASDNGIHAMMLASIAVARSLDMDVTAEGVETESQAALVRMAGCDQIQGWLYYKAMPADELEATLLNNSNDAESVETKIA